MVYERAIGPAPQGFVRQVHTCPSTASCGTLRGRSSASTGSRSTQCAQRFAHLGGRNSQISKVGSKFASCEPHMALSSLSSVASTAWIVCRSVVTDNLGTDDQLTQVAHRGMMITTQDDPSVLTGPSDLAALSHQSGQHVRRVPVKVVTPDRPIV